MPILPWPDPYGESRMADNSKRAITGYCIRVAWWCLGAGLFGGFGSFMAVLFIAAVLIRGLLGMQIPIETIFSIATFLGIIGAVVAIIMAVASSRREIHGSTKRADR